MILIGLGANLPTRAHGPPRSTLTAALATLAAADVALRRLSPWYESEPLPPSGQPWFANAVAEVRTALAPSGLLERLLHTESAFGRRRGEPNAARCIDLDLIDFDGRISRPGEIPVLPHPRMSERAFVLLPLRDIVPDWRHPVTGEPVSRLIGRLPPGAGIRRMANGGRQP